MTLNPLAVLRKGLKVLESRVKTKKEALQTQLAERKSISPQDEQWLDYDANLVDEVQVLEALENASDYDQGLASLNDNQKAIVRKLQEAAGDVSKVVGKKRSRASAIFSVLQLELTYQKAQNTHTKKLLRRRIDQSQFSPRRGMQTWSSTSKS